MRVDGLDVVGILPAEVENVVQRSEILRGVGVQRLHQLVSHAAHLAGKIIEGNEYRSPPFIR